MRATAVRTRHFRSKSQWSNSARQIQNDKWPIKSKQAGFTFDKQRMKRQFNVKESEVR